MSTFIPYIICIALLAFILLPVLFPLRCPKCRSRRTSHAARLGNEINFVCMSCGYEFNPALPKSEKEKVSEFVEEFTGWARKREWFCGRCGQEVDMDKFKCGCAESPSPWEPRKS